MKIEPNGDYFSNVISGTLDSLCLELISSLSLVIIALISFKWNFINFFFFRKCNLPKNMKNVLSEISKFFFLLKHLIPPLPK